MLTAILGNHRADRQTPASRQAPIYLSKLAIDAWIASLTAQEMGEDEVSLMISATQSDETADIVRLGQYLVDHKLISVIDLQDALDLQRVCAMDDEPLLLGEALVRMGAIDEDTLDAAVSMLIIQLRRDSMEAACVKRTLYQRAIKKLSAPRWRNPLIWKRATRARKRQN